MPQLEYFHGTLMHMVPSIADRGLLPREQLEDLGLDVRYPGHTRHGSVYLGNTKYDAGNWTCWGGCDFSDKNDTPIHLKVVLTEEQASKVFPDRNFFDEESTIRPYYFEHPGPICPSQIFVIQGEQAIPIKEFVPVAV